MFKSVIVAQAASLATMSIVEGLPDERGEGLSTSGELREKQKTGGD